jgi:spore germination protein KC
MLAGFDRTEDGLIKVSVHVAKPFAMTGAGQEIIDEKPFWPVSTTGHTVFQAVRNLASESPRQIFWVYDRVLLIGEKLAREEDSITQVLDFYNRDQEPRMGTHLMVVKGTTLDEIMSARFELERQPNRGFDEIGKVVAARKSTSWVPTALEFCRELETEGLEPVLGAAEVVHRPRHEPEQGVLREVTISHTARISGLGAFKGNQLVGWLNDRQSRGVLWVRGKVRSGIIVIKNPQAEERLISLEIRRTGRKITPQMIDGRPVIKIRIDVEGSFGETQEEIQFLGDSELWDSLERRFAAAVRNEVLAALQAAQEDLESDILGLGRAVHNAYPREWQVMKDNWDEIFPTLKVEVEVFATLKTSGLTLRRIRNR